VRKVQAHGDIDFRTRKLFVSQALVGASVALRPTAADGVWEVFYCHHRIRTVDLRGARPPQVDRGGPP
jgi:hypothetical protein